jgi:hypothetical protein
MGRRIPVGYRRNQAGKLARSFLQVLPRTAVTIFHRAVFEQCLVPVPAREDLRETSLLARMATAVFGQANQFLRWWSRVCGTPVA